MAAMAAHDPGHGMCLWFGLMKSCLDIAVCGLPVIHLVWMRALARVQPGERSPWCALQSIHRCIPQAKGVKGNGRFRIGAGRN